MYMRTPVIALTALVALLIPGITLAANPGDLVKLADDKDQATQVDSAVYYLGYDGKRYAFPNAGTYFTWYADFSSVKTVTAAELASYVLGGNVTYRPGTRLVKIQSDPKVYAVEPGGALRGIGSEAIAVALYGPSWNTRIDDVSDAFFTNYTVGTPLETAAYPSGSVVRRTSDNALFYIENGAKRPITTDAIRTSLRIRDEHILTAASLAEYSDSSAVVSGEGTITDTAGMSTIAPDAAPKFTAVVPATTVIGVDTDATLFTVGYAAGAATTVTQIALRIDSVTDKDTIAPDTDDGGLVFRSGPETNIADLRLVDDTGAEPFGRKIVNNTPDNDDTQTFLFTGSWSVPAGTYRTLRLQGHVSTLAPKDDGYKVTLVVSRTTVLKDGASTAFLPAADLAGQSMKTSADDFTVILGPGGGQTHVRGTTGVDINGFTFKATATKANIIRSLKVQGYIDEQEGVTGFLPGSDADNGTRTLVSDIVRNVGLYTSTGKLLAGPVDPDVNGIITFSGFELVIAPGSTANVMLKGDLRSSAEIEQHDDLVAFDIVDARTDMTVVDSDGTAVRAVGTFPNGGSSAARAIKVRKHGTLEVKWTQGTGTAMAGTEITIGNLRMEGAYEPFRLQTLTFHQPQGASVSLTGLRVSHGSGASEFTRSAAFIGNTATFAGLDLAVPTGDTNGITLRVYGTVRPREAGASYGESIKVAIPSTGPMAFSAPSEPSLIEATSFPTSGDYAYIRGGTSSFTVRFSQLSTALVEGSVPSYVYHGTEEEVLRFAFSASESGPVRVRAFAFRLTPADRGTSGADNDAIERWGDLNGDFTDDDEVVNIRHVLADGLGDPLCEDSNGSIDYRVFVGSTEIASPSTRTSTTTDTAVIACEFNGGGELFIPAGGTQTFALELNTAVFSDAKDHSLTITLLSGAGNFAYTDITNGAYTDLTSPGGSISEALTVRK
jgi:hypothetical protein